MVTKIKMVFWKNSKMSNFVHVGSKVLSDVVSYDLLVLLVNPYSLKFSLPRLLRITELISVLYSLTCNILPFLSLEQFKNSTISEISVILISEKY